MSWTYDVRGYHALGQSESGIVRESATQRKERHRLAREAFEAAAQARGWTVERYKQVLQRRGVLKAI